ncbi:MAG: CBS domain-containing protein [Chlamydiales bacterium]|jgi:CBS domain-containing protein
MGKDPSAIWIDHTNKEAAEVLSSAPFHFLPLVNDEHELMGIGTSADLIRYLLSLY